MVGASASAALTYGACLWEINSVNNTLNGSFSFKRHGERTHADTNMHGIHQSLLFNSYRLLEEVLQTEFIHVQVHIPDFFSYQPLTLFKGFFDTFFLLLYLTREVL